MLISHKDLIVWQKSFNLCLELYKVTNKFPKFELYNLTSQIRRNGVSIPSNIAEGYARHNRGEYLQFLYIAYASGAELETQILIAQSLNYFIEDEFNQINNLLSETMKMLNGLISSLKRGL